MTDPPDRTLAVAELARSIGRDDLDARLRAASARVRRPDTIVCVVGEFKSGKSSMVNALLGESVCPVDDDLATSVVTLVHHADEPNVEVRRRVDGQVDVASVELASLREWVTEAGNPDNERGLERVDIGLPNDLLARGVMFVDTPGIGSIRSGYGAATLAFLPWADALIFVSDAAAELSQPEVDFLRRASDLCPNVVFALSKTDISPEWRRIGELDAGHVAASGVDCVGVTVSSTLRQLGQQHDDQVADEESGVPYLLEVLDEDVITPAHELAAARARAETTDVIAQLRSTAAAELEVLLDPSRGDDVATRAAAASAKLDHLRGPGARWSVLVGDRIVDLSNDVSFAFRGALRRISRAAEDDIEQLKTPKDWDELSTRLQSDVAGAVGETFQAIERGAADIEVAVLELLAAEIEDLPPIGTGRRPTDVNTLWAGKGIDDPNMTRRSQALGSTMTGLRGAQSGIIMFGMMAGFLPAGVGALLLAAPVTLSLGAAFAGFQLADAHKRKIAQRRQQARTNVRQYADEVQFDVSNTVGEVLRSVQRGFRDEFGDRIAELQRTYAEAARSAAEAAERDAATTNARVDELRGVMARLAEFDGAPPA